MVFRIQGWVLSSQKKMQRRQKYWFFASWWGLLLPLLHDRWNDFGLSYAGITFHRSD